MFRSSTEGEESAVGFSSTSHLSPMSVPRCHGGWSEAAVCALGALPQIPEAGGCQYITGRGDLWHPLWQAGAPRARSHAPS